MFNTKMKKIKKSGAVAIITVVIVSIAALIMAVGASRMGLGDLLGSYVMQKGNETYSVAEACVEESLRQLKIDSNYTTAGSSLDLGNGQCTMKVTASTISATGTVGSYVRSFTVNFTITGTDITINNWNENP